MLICASYFITTQSWLQGCFDLKFRLNELGWYNKYTWYKIVALLVWIPKAKWSTEVGIGQMDVLLDNDPMALVAYVNNITTSSHGVNEKTFTYVGRIGAQNPMRGLIRAAHVSKAISLGIQNVLIIFVLLLLLIWKWNHLILGVLWDPMTTFQVHVSSNRSTFWCYS